MWELRESKGLNDPLVSVVIPSWNGRHVLSTCLQSLERLSYPNYEVIVVDNGSTDGSREMVRSEFPWVKLVASPTNVGFAAGCNLGIEVAKGDIIALFNNDATAERSWLSKVVACVLNENGTVIAGGPILYHKPAEHPFSRCAGVRLDPLTGITWRLGYTDAFQGTKFIEDIDSLPFCGVAFPKRLLDEIGPLDETYFIYCEDIDWCLNAKRVGYKCKLDCTAVVWHEGSWTGRDHGRARRTTGRGYYHFMRGLFRIYFKHLPLRYMVASLFFQLTLFPVAEVFVFRTSPVLVLRRFQAFVWNLRRLRTTMAARRKAATLGPLTLKSRFAGFLHVARERIAKHYYEFA